MSLETLESRVNETISWAATHASHCEKLVSSGNLAEALAYCAREGINPPQCSLSAQSANADQQRDTAARKLSEQKWWKRALRTKALRSYETEQIALGNVRNYVSDGMAAYFQKYKTKAK